jgi:integrase
MTTMKKKKVEQMHQVKITPPMSENSRWQSYVKGEDGKRKKVSATTEEKLYDKLYDFYFVNVIPTMQELLCKWIEKKKSENLSDRSIRRYVNYWNKYYLDKKIVNMPINKITTELIEVFFHGMIKEFDMTVKELGNMKYPFKEVLKLATREKHIISNPFLNSEIKTFSCKPPKKYEATTRVYLPHEKFKLFDQLNQEIINYPKVTDSHAIFLLFKLGIRIGEVVSLKLTDVDFINREIHIQRTETLFEEPDGVLRPVVVEHTKCGSIHGDRFLTIDDYEIELIQTVLEINRRYGFEDEGYIFIDEEGRSKSRAIDNRIRKLCEKAEIMVKSAHDIRRTVASQLHHDNVPIEIIRAYLGHSDVKTTWGYIYDNQTKRQSAKLISQSLSGMNGLKRTQ